MLRKLIFAILSYRAKKRVHKNATIKGNNHYIGERAKVILMDGATKEQVQINDSCWHKGTIIVQTNGVVILNPHVQIGIDTNIFAVNRIEIGAYTAIAPNTTICDNNNHPVSPKERKAMRVHPHGHDSKLWKHSANAPIIIGENCWIGTNVRICKGVTIGDNSIVAACSVVTKDVPANCIVAGNPAKVVKTNIDLENY